MVQAKEFKLLAAVGAFAAALYNKRDLILSLAVRGFKSSYSGSMFGLAWVIMEPLIYALLLWFFFTKAMKFQPPEGYPYVPWLMSAMVLWNFFSHAFSSSANTFRNHAFLLKKPEFNMAILPVVSILTSLFIHAIFLAILVVVLEVSEIAFTVYWFQSIYYLFATVVLLVGMAWITASLSLFLKDVGNLIGILLQIGFWISPIFWSLETFPQKYRFMLEINPLSYVMEGYRKSFIYGQPFWSDWKGFIYYWSFTLIILGVGVITYRKLRPHFGDVI